MNSRRSSSARQFDDPGLQIAFIELVQFSTNLSAEVRPIFLYRPDTGKIEALYPSGCTKFEKALPGWLLKQWVMSGLIQLFGQSPFSFWEREISERLIAFELPVGLRSYLPSED